MDVPFGPLGHPTRLTHDPTLAEEKRNVSPILATTNRACSATEPAQPAGGRTAVRFPVSAAARDPGESDPSQSRFQLGAQPGYVCLGTRALWGRLVAQGPFRPSQQ